MNRGHQLYVATGYLGDDAKVMAFQAGGLVAELSVAVTETYRTSQGQEEHTEWVHAKAFDTTAEVCQKLATRGRLVTIQGRLHTETWNDAAGTRQRKTYVYISQGGFTLHGGQEHTVTSPGRERARNAPAAPDFRPKEQTRHAR